MATSTNTETVAQTVNRKAINIPTGLTQTTNEFHKHPDEPKVTAVSAAQVGEASAGKNKVVGGATSSIGTKPAAAGYSVATGALPQQQSYGTGVMYAAGQVPVGPIIYQPTFSAPCQGIYVDNYYGNVGVNFYRSFPSSKIYFKTLIINYLPRMFGERELQALFGQIGRIAGVSVPKDPKTGRSRGFAFVKYKFVQDAVLAIEQLNGIQIDNKWLKVSFARKSCQEIQNANIYIRNIPPHYTEMDLGHLFGYFGRIINLRILRYHPSNISRGLALIRFDLGLEAHNAIRTLNGYMPPGGRDPLIVKLARKFRRTRETGAE